MNPPHDAALALPQSAIQHHETGRLDAAELADRPLPDNPDAPHLRSMNFLQRWLAKATFAAARSRPPCARDGRRGPETRHRWRGAPAR